MLMGEQESLIYQGKVPIHLLVSTNENIHKLILPDARTSFQMSALVRT